MKKGTEHVCSICGTHFLTTGHSRRNICSDCLWRLFNTWERWKAQDYPLQTHCLMCGKPMTKRTDGNPWLRKGSCSPACESLLNSVRRYYGNRWVLPADHSTGVRGHNTLTADIAAASAAGMSYGLYMVEKRKHRQGTGGKEHD